MKGTSIAGAILVLTLQASGAAQAADSRKLRVADWFPKTHYVIKLVLDPWMKEVTRRTNGAITFEHYPAQQLGKGSDMLTLTQSGVADIGSIAPSYISDKLPVSEVAMLPAIFGDVCQGTQAYWKLSREGAIATNDFAANKIRPLIVLTLPQYRIFTTKNAVKTIEDVRGLKIRGSGGSQDLTARALDAVSVRMSAPELYESLARGTLDGTFLSTESSTAYSLEKLVRHGTNGVGFGSFVITYSISDRIWNELSPDVQRAMVEVTEEILPVSCKQAQSADEEHKRKMEAAGVRFGDISGDAHQRFKELLDGVSRTWAAGLDARGKPGSQALKEFEAAIAATATK